MTPRVGKLGGKQAIDFRAVGGNAVGLDAELVKGNEDLINFLEHKLEQQEKNLLVKQQEYDALLLEHHNLQS